jgi:hypothetical protein
MGREVWMGSGIDKKRGLGKTKNCIKSGIGKAARKEGGEENSDIPNKRETDLGGIYCMWEERREREKKQRKGKEEEMRKGVRRKGKY